MERHSFAMELKEGKKNDYRRKLGEIWPELTAYLDRNGIHNFSIWNAADLVFGYYENADGAVISPEEEKVKAALTEKIGDTFTWISTPGKDMRLMYHNFGVVRENKELIRHRMFMTKLKDGCEEEYKARHDGLVAQRGETIDPGPDSNFSIWSAGGYIFGYDEIDITMEVEETPEAREATIAWETRQLGIMDWITNDVDWMTKVYVLHGIIKKWEIKKEGGRGFVWRQPRQYEKEKSVIKGSTLCTSNNILIFCGHSVTSF